MNRVASALELAGFGLVLAGAWRLSAAFGLIVVGLLAVGVAQAVDR